MTNGLGADGVYDPVGGDIFVRVAPRRSPRREILIVGFASGDVPRIRADILLVKNIEVIGHNWGAYETLDPAIPRASFAEIFDPIAAGRLKPHVTRVEPLSGVVSALDDLKAGRTAGKVVVDLTADENGWNSCPFIQNPDSHARRRARPRPDFHPRSPCGETRPGANQGGGDVAALAVKRLGRLSLSVHSGWIQRIAWRLLHWFGHRDHLHGTR